MEIKAITRAVKKNGGKIVERVVSNLKVKDLELIKGRTSAFLGNVEGTLVLFQSSKKYIYVMIDKDNKYNDIYEYYNDNIFENYVYSAEGIADLCGWLYGVVQTKNGMI